MPTSTGDDPLATPDGEFGWTEHFRAQLSSLTAKAAQPTHAPLLAAPSIDAFVSAAYRAGELFKAPALLLAIERFGDQALRLLPTHMGRLSAASQTKNLLIQSSHGPLRELLPVWLEFRHPGVLERLIRYPDDPFLLTYTERLVLRWPVYAIKRMVATSASSATPLVSMMVRLVHEHPSWIAPLEAQGGWPEWFASALKLAGQTNEAQAWPADIPELLRHPPWQREKKPTAKEKLEQPWLKLPPKLPALPAFWSPILQTRPLLRESRQPLPPAAVHALLTMCMLSKPAAPYAGLAQVLPALERESAAQLGRDLLARWEAAECPLEERWILLAQAWLGDAHTLRTVSDAIARWPGEMAFPRAKFGLSVLADMAAFQRSDEPLRALIRFAEKGKPSLRKPAQEQLQKAAQGMGITADELADRVIPDLGLAQPEDHVFDFGPRRFTLRFDDSLQPFLIDDGGRRLGDLPKPNAKDDASLAPDAVKRWKALKKQARALANEQIARLERALASQRTWSASAFTRLFLRHPLMRELGRRLLWSTTGAQQPAVRFRVSEEYTLLDVHDAPVTLDEGASVCLAHPIDLEAVELAAWAQSWADYELLQPFEQLARRVYRLDDAAAGAGAGGDVPSARGQPVAAGSLLGLVQRGWARMQEGYHVLGLRYTTPHGGAATLHLQDPMDVAAPLSVPVLTIHQLSLDTGLTPLERSEVLRAVDQLARS